MTSLVNLDKWNDQNIVFFGTTESCDHFTYPVAYQMDKNATKMSDLLQGKTVRLLNMKGYMYSNDSGEYDISVNDASEALEIAKKIDEALGASKTILFGLTFSQWGGVGGENSFELDLGATSDAPTEALNKCHEYKLVEGEEGFFGSLQCKIAMSDCAGVR